MSINRPKAVAGIKIPDSTIAQQATELLLEHGSVFLYNHSLRSFCFASLNGTKKKIQYDPELLYVSAVFHDLGLCPHYSSPDKAFEVDGIVIPVGLNIYPLPFKNFGFHMELAAIAGDGGILRGSWGIRYRFLRKEK